MGQLLNGTWEKKLYDATKRGEYERQKTLFRGAVTADDVELGRYHLYVSYACPWAHRTLVVRALEGLEQAVPVSVVGPRMGDDGWAFGGFDGATADGVHGAAFLRETYVRARADYTGRVTVPVL